MRIYCDKKQTTKDTFIGRKLCARNRNIIAQQQIENRQQFKRTNRLQKYRLIVAGEKSCR